MKKNTDISFGASISPHPVELTQGKDQNVTIIPEEGYRIIGFSYNNQNYNIGNNIVGNSFTLTYFTQNSPFVINIKANEYIYKDWHETVVVIIEEIPQNKLNRNNKATRSINATLYIAVKYNQN